MSPYGRVPEEFLTGFGAVAILISYASYCSERAGKLMTCGYLETQQIGVWFFGG